MPVAGGRRAAQIASLMTTPPRLRSQAGGRDFSRGSRILIWLQSQSLGESTGRADGNRNMTDNCASRGTIRNLYLILSNPLIFLMKN